MSWSIYAYGSKEAVKAKVEASVISESSPDIEKTQHAEVRVLLLLTLAGVPADFTKGEVFKVEANGSASTTGTGEIIANSVSLKVEKSKLDVV